MHAAPWEHWRRWEGEERQRRGRVREGERGGVTSAEKRLDGLDRRKMSFHFSSEATYSLMTRRNATTSRRLRRPPVCCESHDPFRSDPRLLNEHTVRTLQWHRGANALKLGLQQLVDGIDDVDNINVLTQKRYGLRFVSLQWTSCHYITLEVKKNKKTSRLIDSMKNIKQISQTWLWLAAGQKLSPDSFLWKYVFLRSR